MVIFHRNSRCSSSLPTASEDSQAHACNSKHQDGGIKCPKELEEGSEEKEQGGKTTVLVVGMSPLYSLLSLLVPFQLATQAH